MFIRDKSTAQKVKGGDNKSTKNTKKTISEKSSDELKLQSRSLLKESYKPTLPSTYVKEKRTSLLKPGPIRIKLLAQLPNVSKIGDFMVIKAIPFDTEE